MFGKKNEEAAPTPCEPMSTFKVDVEVQVWSHRQMLHSEVVEVCFLSDGRPADPNREVRFVLSGHPKATHATINGVPRRFRTYASSYTGDVQYTFNFGDY